MKTKCLLWIIIAMLFISLPLSAQAGSPVFAPFVSQFDAEVRNNLIRLSWKDSADVRGPIYIYRSAAPFDSGTQLSENTPAEIPYGVQSHVDEIESSGTFYYFAVASDETGRRYDIPIANTNTASVTAAVTHPIPAAPAARTPVEARTAIPPNPETGISSIAAEPRDDRIIITFSEGNVKNATLYRSTRPISQTQDLLGAVIIQTKTSSPYTDNPVPGIPYYYAVIAEEDLIRGMVEIVPGRNATRSPAEVPAAGPESDLRGRELRPMPLPQISTPVSGSNTFTGTHLPVELSPQASKALGDIPASPRIADSVLKKPRVFARDLQDISGRGEDYILTTIVKGSLSAKNWEAAGEELNWFLALPRGPDATARAKFYLGQCYYFQYRPREGLFEFLAIQDRYPAEAREWIDASLEMMRN